MKKKLSFIIAFIVLVFIISIFLIPGIDRNANIPKYKQKLWGSAFNIFMVLPDPIKSTLMIFSGKRSFSNLFNDYNVKFLPETQYIKINFKRKVLKYKKKNRNTFFLETYKNSIFVVTKYGEILRINLDQLKNKSKNLPYKKIETINLLNIPGYILDTLIIEDKIYISKVSKYKNCKKLEIFSADILDEILNFNIFKTFDECANIGIGAGRIINYKLKDQQGILLSTADSDNDKPGQKSQDENSIFGKILFINLKSKQYKIFSKGHRNVQGLSSKNEIVISTEHGPKGGDEINKIILGKNYGWPIVSYGEPYESKELKYLKSHSAYNFEEPIHTFLPSIGISELMFLPDNFNLKWQNNILVTSLNGRSIYRVKFEDDTFNNIVYVEKIFIGERIRDIKYVDKLKLIIVALERTGDIGILQNK